MGALAFDTLKFAKRLKEAGFSEKQAEAEAELFEAKLERQAESMRAELKRDLKNLEYRLVIKLGAMLVVAVGAVAALVKLLQASKIFTLKI